MESSVRIIVPMYNAQYWIVDLLQSILSQTFMNWECVLIDDASTDKTVFIVQSWIASLQKGVQEKFIVLTHNENKQVSISRNDGLQYISEKIPEPTYTYFADADDVLEPELLSVAVQEADTYQVPLLQFGHYCIKGRSKKDWFRKLIPIKQLHNSIDTKWYCSVWNFLFKTEYIKKYNIQFDPDLSQGEDELFLLQFSWYMFKEGLQYLSIPNLLYQYRYLNPTSLIVVCSEADKQAYKRKIEAFIEGKKEYGKVVARMKEVAGILGKRNSLIQFKDTIPIGIPGY